MTGAPLLELKDLGVTRGTQTELEHFSLTLNAGDTVVLLGEAGCGKEAVLRVLNGQLERGEDVTGTIRFGENEPADAARKPRRAVRIAYLPAAASKPLNPVASVASQLARVIARKLDCPRGAAREELRNALSRLIGAPSFEILDTPPGRLDAATITWGLLAAASAVTPELLICDHSFADLSPATARMFTVALLAEKARLGFALLYAARGPQVIARVGGRALILRRGKVIEEGDAEHLMGGQTHGYTHTLFKALPKPPADKPPRSAARGEPLLQVQGLILHPQPKKTPRARDGISFELRRGASLALIGEEGSGRRVLARAVLGLERRPGRVLFDAVDLNLLSPAMTARLRRRMAFITGADEALDPRMTLWDTVEEPLRAHLKLSRDLVAGYRDSALKRVGLASHRGSLTVSALPAFDKRRVQVARAIVAAPLLVVVDEPLAGLDAVAQTTMRDLLADFRTEQQAAFLVITNDFSVAETLADEAMIFDGGRMVERGPIRELLRAPKDATTRALVDAARFEPLSRALAAV
jgi:peptide/nickel transport system ATP-binding protein